MTRLGEGQVGRRTASAARRGESPGEIDGRSRQDPAYRPASDEAPFGEPRPRSAALRGPAPRLDQLPVAALAALRVAHDRAHEPRSQAREEVDQAQREA